MSIRISKLHSIIKESIQNLLIKEGDKFVRKGKFKTPFNKKFTNSEDDFKQDNTFLDFKPNHTFWDVVVETEDGEYTFKNVQGNYKGAAIKKVKQNLIDNGKSLRDFYVISAEIANRNRQW